MSNEVMTLTEVTKMLRTTRQTVVKRVEDGTIPALKLGNEYRFSRTAIEEKLRGENK